MKMLKIMTETNNFTKKKQKLSEDYAVYCLFLLKGKRQRSDSVLWQKEEKKEIWFSPMTKALTSTENPKSNVTTQKRHQNFDYTTIADWLRTVSWGNDSHPTGVVKPVYGIPTFPLTAKAV